MNDYVIGILSSISATVIVLTLSKFVRDLFKSRKKITLIESVLFNSTPFFKNNSKIYLSKVNYIYGKNSTGKTAIAEWLSVLADDKNISRWIIKDDFLPILFSIGIKATTNNNIAIEIDSNGVNYFVNEKKYIISPVNCRFVLLADNQIDNKNLDSITYLSKQLRITEQQLIQLIKNFNPAMTLTIHSIKIIDKEPERHIQVKLYEGVKYVRFNNLSVSEQQRVMIDLGIQYCAYLSKISFTFLVIEKNTFCIDDEYYLQLVDKLLNDLFVVQSLIISVDAPLANFNHAMKTLVFTGEVPYIQILET